MPKLNAPTDKPIELDAIHANLGVEAAYRKRLQALIVEMNNSVIYWTRAAWRKEPPAATMAHDADPIATLRRLMKRLGKHWQKKFDDVSRELSESFADKSIRHTDAAMMASLKKAGFTVKFKFTKKVREAYGAVIEENVGLIRSIPAEYLHDVQAQVWQSVKSGHDLGTLTDNLYSKYDITFKRASLIARDQSNKAKAVIEKVRRQQMGIKQAIWQHSGGGKEPRPGHLKAGKDKLVYNLDEGAYIDGEYIMPGEKINCRCTSRAIIPGLNK